MGFGAEIGMVAGAKVGKSSTANRGADSNIEGLDVNDSAADLIALMGLIILPGLVLPGRRVVVVAIRFSYFFISF